MILFYLTDGTSLLELGYSCGNVDGNVLFGCGDFQKNRISCTKGLVYEFTHDAYQTSNNLVITTTTDFVNENSLSSDIYCKRRAP